MWHQDYPNLSVNLCFPGSSVVKNSPANAGDFPDSSVGKESTCNSGDPYSIHGLGRSPRERKGYPLQYSGLEYSPWGRKELPHDWATFTHTHISSIPGSGRSPGGRNGNPRQYSCLENPMDREAWWAIVHGVAKELDMTEWLNNRSSNKSINLICASRIVCIYVNIQIIPMYRYL